MLEPPYGEGSGWGVILTEGEGGRVAGRQACYSTAFTMSSTTFFASPNTIIVLSM
jgi:hypothetical protein